MSKKIFLFLIIILLTINYSFIVLPIDTLPRENYVIDYLVNSPKYIINNEYQEYFYTELEMGTPFQKIPLIIKTESSYFIITSINSIENDKSFQYRDIFNFSESLFNDNNYKFYNENKSVSYILNNCDYPKVYQAVEYCNSNETFLFYNDIKFKNKTKGEKVYFELMRNVEDNITGEIGLNLYDRNRWSFNSFINIMKTRSFIDNYNWFFDFDSFENKKGKIIVGALPHEIYPDNYHFDDLMYAPSISQNFVIYWRMEFDKIYIKINNNKNNILYFNDTTIEFKFDSNVIIGTLEYENYIVNIFGKFLKEEKCFHENISDYKSYINRLKFFYCKNDNKIKKELYSLLPNLYFYSHEFNYTFEIKNDDLFIIKNEYIYYKVLFGTNNDNKWYLGKPMTLKYKFIFNPETKQIGFYNKYYNPKGNKKDNYIIVKIIVIIALSILLIFLGIKIGKMIYGMKRKKRANELDDNYDYMSDEKEQKNDIDIEVGINN